MRKGQKNRSYRNNSPIVPNNEVEFWIKDNITPIFKNMKEITLTQRRTDP